MIWIVASHCDLPADAFAVLNQNERKQSARLMRAADRAAFIATRAALRFILSAVIDAAPADIKFTSNSNGKPSLSPVHARDDVDFNVSHTDGFSAIALSHRGAIGVDIERRRFVPDRIGIVSRLFGSRVARQLAMFPAERQNEIFLQLWTTMEAYAKATGLGLAGIGEHIPVSLTIDGTPLLDPPSTPHCMAPWSLLPIAPAADYVCSVIVAGSNWTPHCSDPPETTTLAALSAAHPLVSDHAVV